MDRLISRPVLVVFLWTQCIGIAFPEKIIYRDPMTSVTFYCQFDDQEPKGFRIWKMESPDKLLFTNQKNLTGDKYYSLDTRYQSWNLVISTILERHKGVYLCMKSSRNGWSTVEKYTLIINGPPSLAPSTPWLYKESVQEGNTARLQCNFTGSPPPSIQWFVEENDKLRPIHIRGPVLLISNGTRACGTRFVCLAENRFSKTPINMTFELEVAFPAQILVYDVKSPTRDVTLTEIYRQRSVEVILRCDVMMLPDVKISWKIRKKNSKLKEIASYTPGGEVPRSSKGSYSFQVKVLPQKRVTMFDLVFVTDQENTYAEYVCETDGGLYPGNQRSLTIHKLQ